MKHIPRITLKMVREDSVPYASVPLSSSQAVSDFFRPMVADADREAVWIACLDTKNKPTCVSQISVGTLDASLAHPREVFKIALLANARSIVMVHNHPSGDTTPSHADHAMTDRIKRAAEIMGIAFLDHVILGDEDFYSFRDGGAL